MDFAALADRESVLKAFKDAASFSAGNPKPEKLEIEVPTGRRSSGSFGEGAVWFLPFRSTVDSMSLPGNGFA
jgi:hypothetical protein